MTAIVLAGHGSRAQEANAALGVLAHTLANDLGVRAYPAYLEMTEPAIPDALRRARADGADRIVVVPYFLSPGMHVRRDLVGIVDAARVELGITIELADFLGAHPDVPRLLGDLARATLAVKAS